MIYCFRGNIVYFRGVYNRINKVMQTTNSVGFRKYASGMLWRSSVFARCSYSAYTSGGGGGGGGRRRKPRPQHPQPRPLLLLKHDCFPGAPARAVERRETPDTYSRVDKPVGISRLLGFNATPIHARCRVDASSDPFQPRTHNNNLYSLYTYLNNFFEF